MTALILFILGAGLVGAFYMWRLGTVFNPPSLFAFGLAASSAIAIVMDFLAEDYELHAGFVTDPTSVAVVYGVGVITFTLPWLLASSRRRTKVRALAADRGVRVILPLLMCAIWGFLLLTFGLLGGVPLFRMLVSDYSIVDHINSLQNLWPGIMLVNLSLGTLLALYLSSISTSRREERIGIYLMATAVITMLFASSWQGNRQLILIFLFVVAARRFIKLALLDQSREVRRERQRLQRFCFIGGVLFFLFFVTMNYIRLASLGVHSGPTELLLYFSWPVYNVVAIDSQLGMSGIGSLQYVLTGLLPARWGGKDQMKELAVMLFEPTSPSGYLAYWFVDFGVPGVAVGAGLLGLASRFSFKRMCNSEHEMRKHILVLWCCATAAVYSHFISLAYFWVPLLFLEIVERLFQTIRRLKTDNI